MRLAEIFTAVRPDTRELPGDMRKALAKANTERLGADEGGKFSKGFGRGLSRLAVAAGGALATLAIGNKIKESINAASDLNETISKTDQVFGKSSKAIQKFAADAPTALGQSKKAALDANATFGLFGKTAGLTGGKLVGFTTSLTTLASDMASFSNTTPEQAIDALGAALRGESEPIRAYGVLLDDATLKAEALRLGLVKGATDTGKIAAAQIRAEVAQRKYNAAVKEHGKNSTEAKTAQAGLITAQGALNKATAGTIPPLTQQQRVLAAQSAIMRQTKDAQGDFARTSAGLANQQRIAAAQTDRLKVAIGNALLPVVLKGATALNKDLLPPLIALAEKHGPAFAATLDRVGKDAGPKIMDFFDKIGPQIKSFADGTNEASPALTSLADSGSKLGPLVTSLNDKLPSLTDALTVGAEVVGFFADNTDTLNKLMPVLVGLFVAYKVAQLAANAAAVLSVPTKVAEVFVNRQLVKSNRELIASRTGVVGSTIAETVATSANTGAKQAGVLASIRARAAIIAQGVAQKAVAIATAAWTAAQWLLNAAMTANPIGLVIALVAGLAIGLIALWKKSETFRNVITGVFNGIKEVIRTVIIFVWDKISGFFQNIIDGAAKIFGWVPGVGDKLKLASKAFGQFKDDVNQKLAGIKDQEITVTAKLNAANMNQKNANDRRLAKAGLAGGGKVWGPGTPTSDSIPARLSRQEWVIQAKASMKYGDYAMASVNAGTATVIPGGDMAGFAKGGTPRGVSVSPSLPDPKAWAQGLAAAARAAAVPMAQSLANELFSLAGTVAWGKSQAGKPYVWGGSGPGGYDCSGFVSALVNHAQGRSPFRRLGATGSMPWASMTSGTGPFMVGWFKGNPGHTAATIDGVNFESAGGVGVRYGARARGANDAMFNQRRKIKGFARGGREGRDGDAPFDLFNPRGDDFMGRNFMRQVGLPLYDGGGMVNGTGLFAKGTNAPERMLDPRTTVAFERLVEWLEGNGGGGPTVHQHFPAASGAAAEEAAGRFLSALGRS